MPIELNGQEVNTVIEIKELEGTFLKNQQSLEECIKLAMNRLKRSVRRVVM